jgi:hypothetical protein
MEESWSCRLLTCCWRLRHAPSSSAVPEGEETDGDRREGKGMEEEGTDGKGAEEKGTERTGAEARLGTTFVTAAVWSGDVVLGIGPECMANALLQS